MATPTSPTNLGFDIDKTAPQLDPPKDDPIDSAYLAKCDGELRPLPLLDSGGPKRVPVGVGGPWWALVGSGEMYGSRLTGKSLTMVFSCLTVVGEYEETNARLPRMPFWRW